MSYEDLEEARAKRAAKDAAKVKGKGKRGTKPKSAALEAEEAAWAKGNMVESARVLRQRQMRWSRRPKWLERVRHQSR